MNLYQGLRRRAEEGRPLTVGLIGAGKFGTMFLAQARRTPGLHLLAIADLRPDHARVALRRTGWPEEQADAGDAEAARVTGATWLTDDAMALIAADGLDIVIDATGDAPAGPAHAAAAIDHGRHVIMVIVEADVLAGPLLARRAARAGVVYSLAYGDQPALICELVDWARASGFAVVCAGKGTRYLPEYRRSTPETVWQHYGLSAEEAARGGMNPQMFNSFIDGTKSAIEMAAVANACGLIPPADGLAFPPCGTDRLPEVLKPRSDGGVLADKGTVEVVSSVGRDGSPVANHLRWGVYVCFEAGDDYVARCFAEYGLVTDSSGRYSALYRPAHLIGLELGISVASAGLRGEPTGAPGDWRADVAALAKRPLEVGEILDGEGGYTVRGQLMPAGEALKGGLLPLGLSRDVRLVNAVAEGAPVRWADVAVEEAAPGVSIRREMERAFAPDRAA